MTGLSRRRIAITGASGLVGTALSTALRGEGNDVLAISRHPAAAEIGWDPARREIDAAALHGVDAVIHLAGASIAGGRWTTARKALLRESRVPPTRWHADTQAQLARPPRVLISASAIGIYGDSGEDLVDEATPPGDDFLAHLTADWERAADPARDARIRVVHPRFGVILSRRGGALGTMLPPFRLGLGGPMGSGRQWMSWIAIDDVVGGISHALADESLDGPVNYTTQNPVRNAAFAAALGHALHRPAIIRVPAWALRLILGEIADVALLASQRVAPTKLLASGYVVKQPELAGALHYVLAAR